MTHWLSPETYPITQEGWSRKADYALSDFADNPQDVKKLTNQIIDHASQLLSEAGVSESSFSKVPIYLGATAGMRVIDASKRDAVMAQVRANFEASPFKFSDHYANVISGEEEAIFGFIASNYLMGEFTDNSDPNKAIGALDLGGASTQITFGTTGTLLEGVWDLKGPNHKRYYTYTRSFLYYGLEQWKDRIHNRVAEGTPTTEGGNTYEHPCLNTGAEMDFTTVPNTLDGPATVRQVHFIGKSDSDACAALTRDIMHFDDFCWSKECAFMGVYMPAIPDTAKFVAFSSFPRVLSTAGFPGADEQYVSLEDIRKYTHDELCAWTWEELQQKLPDSPVEYLKVSCLALNYVYTLLAEGYKFDPNEKQITFKRSIQPSGLDKPIEVTWALGRMIYEANLLPYAVKLPTQKSADVAIVMCVFFSIGFAIMCVLWYRERQRKSGPVPVPEAGYTTIADQL